MNSTGSAFRYQTDKVYLAPYSQELARSQDGLLGYLYLQTKNDALLDIAFPGLPYLYMDKFVSYLAGPKVTMQVYYLKGEEPESPMTAIGYCFVFNVDGEPPNRMAEFGFCFFKKFWARREIRELGWLCIAYWFEELKIDVLYGATRVDNYLARNYSRRFGFEEMAILPKFLRGQNERIDARIVMLEKERFMPLWEQHQK